MGRLQVLPANIANMIAAGEVVQRPSSVVKELMENAIDAGADQVSVIISDSGRTLVQVIDNGCGMSPEDALLCFERHATSKIASADDLNGILTYGFRGEALASIAAVSEVTLKTRREQDETATMVRIAEFGKVETSQVSAPVGSSFAIRNLFYNTPARRKFLKSDNVEFKHIVEEFTHVAINRPETGFTLTHNGKDIFVLKKAKSLKFRILDLLGSGVVGDIVDISTETALLKLHGFIGRPDTARKTLGNQYFSVNGRYFRSAYLHKAVMKAYEEMMPEGLTPSYFLFLEIDPQSIDVNIHPTKTEIKFQDDSVVFQIIYASVRETLGRNSFGASIDFEATEAIQMPEISRSYQEYRSSNNGAAAGMSPAVDFDPDYNPFDPDGTRDKGKTTTSAQAPSFYKPDPGQYVNRTQDYGRLFEEKVMPSTQTIILHHKYIITQTASGMMVINIRRAQERIRYEHILRMLSNGEHASQQTMFPISIQVGVSQKSVFDEHATLLASLGFDISSLGNDTIVVNGVPEGYSCQEGKVREMIGDIQLILAEDFTSLPEVMRSRIAERFAILDAANLSPVSTAIEANKLIDTLFACDNSEHTPSGRRIVKVMPMEDIDKQF